MRGIQRGTPTSNRPRCLGVRFICRFLGGGALVDPLTASPCWLMEVNMYPGRAPWPPGSRVRGLIAFLGRWGAGERGLEAYMGQSFGSGSGERPRRAVFLSDGIGPPARYHRQRPAPIATRKSLALPGDLHFFKIFPKNLK